MEHTVEITDETKIFPEEDYEYEGTVNGKEFEATIQYGMAPISHVEGVNEDLSLEEQDAVMEEVR